MRAAVLDCRPGNPLCDRALPFLRRGSSSWGQLLICPFVCTSVLQQRQQDREQQQQGLCEGSEAGALCPAVASSMSGAGGWLGSSSRHFGAPLCHGEDGGAHRAMSVRGRGCGLLPLHLQDPGDPVAFWGAGAGLMTRFRVRSPGLNWGECLRQLWNRTP